MQLAVTLAIVCFLLIILIVFDYYLLFVKEKKNKLHLIWFTTVWIVVVVLVLGIVMVNVYDIGDSRFSFIKFNEIKKKMVLDKGTNSMSHEGYGFDLWWEKNSGYYPDITKEQFRKFPLHNGFECDEMLFELPASAENVAIGDVVAFEENSSEVKILHRVMKKWQENKTYYFKTKGDNNKNIYWKEEMKIPENRIVSKALFKRPFLSLIAGLLVKTDCGNRTLPKDYFICGETEKKLLCKFRRNFKLEHCERLDDRDTCYWDWAKNSSKYCCGIEKEWRRNSCFKETAIKEQNLSLCCNVYYQNLREDCFLALASEEKNITICDALGDDFTKGMCYRNVGMEIEELNP